MVEYKYPGVLKSAFVPETHSNLYMRLYKKQGVEITVGQEKFFVIVTQTEFDSSHLTLLADPSVAIQKIRKVY